MDWLMKVFQKSRLLSGYNLTLVNRKPLRKLKRACRSSWSRSGSLQSFTLTIFLDFGKACELGIIVRQRRTYRKRLGLLKEQCAE